MGEATYYFKAKFKSEQAAAEALPKIKKFIAEGIKAADWWQAHRHQDNKVFWPAFKKKFPTVTKYLASYTLRNYASEGPGPALGCDCNNGLAGQLDFGSSEGWEDELEQHGDQLHYCSGEISHFADWEPFMKFLESEYGAVNTAYVSDEYANPLDSLTV